MKHRILWGMIAIALVLAGAIMIRVVRSSGVDGAAIVQETHENSEAVAAEPERDAVAGETSSEPVSGEAPEEAVADAAVAEENAPEKPTSEETAEAARQTDSGYYGALRVNGSKLTDSEGNPVQLRGVSTHGLAWYPEYVNEEAIAFMHREWGINVIRLALYTAGSGGYCVSGTEQREALEELIDIGVCAAAANHMYVVIDWHILEDGNPNSYKEQAAEFFTEMSAKYRDYDNVLYEICNEPNGGTTWADIRAYAEDIIPLIRTNDEDAVIIVGTPDWCQGVDAAAADPLSDQENIMYALHFYAGSHKEDLRNRAEQALAAGLPLFVSEFGLCDASGNGANDLEQADLWMNWMNENSVSCIQWNLSNKGETCALINSSSAKTTDWEEDELSESGKWMKANMGEADG